jgi:hypothetical protein
VWKVQEGSSCLCCVSRKNGPDINKEEGQMSYTHHTTGGDRCAYVKRCAFTGSSAII